MGLNSSEIAEYRNAALNLVKKAKEIKRVTDLEAAELVKRDWNYCPKSEWKKVRDKKPEGKKSNKKKSK